MTVEFHASKVSMRAIGSLKPYEKNNRKHPPAQVSALAKIIADGGWTQPIVIDEDNVILSGHGRLLAAKELKLAKVPCVTATGLSEAQKRAMRISDNQSGLMGGADWDLDNLKFEIDALKLDDFDLDLTGFSLGDIEGLFSEPEDPPEPKALKSLSERFGIPPFSVMNAREGWWQDRKRAWLALGIKSEIGRGENLIPNGGGAGSKQRYDTDSASKQASKQARRSDMGQRAASDGKGLELLPKQTTLGATPPNGLQILKRTGKYKVR